MNEHCQCDGPGQCGRHQIEKSFRCYELCKGTAGTSDCGLRYWQAWERGELGATAPACPIYEPDGFCAKPVSGGVGTELTKILSWFGMQKQAGCNCDERARVMDVNGIKWCEDNTAKIVDWLMEAWDKEERSLVDFFPVGYQSTWLRSVARRFPERQVAEWGATKCIRLAIENAKGNA